jgi:ribosome biogenesis protein SSF1/2
MAKRRKNRTHLKGGTASSGAATVDPTVPKSFVIRHGQVGSSLTQLVRDMRRLMEPHTASRLKVCVLLLIYICLLLNLNCKVKERSRNKLRDFLSIAPALGVSHLLAFTLAPVAPVLRLVRLPAGPSLTFRIERYSLCKDIRAGSKRSRSIGLEYLSPPLVSCFFSSAVNVHLIAHYSSYWLRFHHPDPTHLHTSRSS